MSSEDPRQRLAYDRTLLANERTFAAWLRTGLSVAAFGVAAAHLIPPVPNHPWLTIALGGLFVAVAIATVAFGAWRFARVNRDLEHDGSPAAPLARGAVHAMAAAVCILLGALLFLF